MAPKNKKTQGAGGPNPVWGAYKPDIRRTYPDPPVRGHVVQGRNGKEFRPEPGQLDRRHRVGYGIGDWIVHESYDHVVELMREEADKAIQDLKAGIDRLQRFIDRN